MHVNHLDGNELSVFGGNTHRMVTVPKHAIGGHFNRSSSFSSSV